MIQAMRKALDRSSWLILLPLVAGFALRLWIIRNYAVTGGDALIYGNIASNWLLHGVYGLDSSGVLHPTLIRLPGYPLFLLLCFRLFGVGHDGPILYVQAIADLITCLLVATIARRIGGPRTYLWALWLAAICPFSANYTAVPLSETLELLATAAAFYAWIKVLDESRWLWACLLAVAAASAALLRPDGALVGLTLYPALVLYGRSRLGLARSLRFLSVCLLLTWLPFAAWALRNWQTFHVFQPLVSRHANEPYESASPGFNRWVATVCADLACTSDVYWNEDSGPINLNDLPSRAFNSPAEWQETSRLLDEYNDLQTLTPAIDARFGALAAERIRRHPLRYEVQMPLLRLADMWLRPRVEFLPVDLRWWQYSKHPGQTIFAWAYAALNASLLVAAAFGVVRRPRFAGSILAFLLLRCLTLLIVEAPEPRYTLECFPLLLALAAGALSGSPTSESPVYRGRP